MGILISLVIITLWATLLFNSLMFAEVDLFSPFFYLRIILMTFLYTGLFITAHDSMHGTVSKNRRLNNLIGSVACFLFAGFKFRELKKKHFMHHSDPTGDTDPDFSQGSQNFFVWFGRFLKGYSGLFQLVTMAVIFNLLAFFFSEPNVISFWLVPSLISSLQLFYFGTYLPHRWPDEGLIAPHFARSQSKNHLKALLTCYFFGYHHEHHASPGTPWWKLHKLVG